MSGRVRCHKGCNGDSQNSGRNSGCPEVVPTALAQGRASSRRSGGTLQSAPRRRAALSRRAMREPQCGVSGDGLKLGHEDVDQCGRDPARRGRDGCLGRRNRGCCRGPLPAPQEPLGVHWRRDPSRRSVLRELVKNARQQDEDSRRRARRRRSSDLRRCLHCAVRLPHDL